MTKPFIPIAQITTIAEPQQRGALRIDFTDTRGVQGTAEFSPAAVARLAVGIRQLALPTSPGDQGDVPTIEITGTAKAAMADGGYGLLLGLSGGGAMLARIPAAILAGLRQQIGELDQLANASPSPPHRLS